MFLFQLLVRCCFNLWRHMRLPFKLVTQIKLWLWHVKTDIHFHLIISWWSMGLPFVIESQSLPNKDMNKNDINVSVEMIIFQFWVTRPNADKIVCTHLQNICQWTRFCFWTNERATCFLWTWLTTSQMMFGWKQSFNNWHWMLLWQSSIWFFEHWCLNNSTDFCFHIKVASFVSNRVTRKKK